MIGFAVSVISCKMPRCGVARSVVSFITLMVTVVVGWWLQKNVKGRLMGETMTWAHSWSHPRLGSACVACTRLRCCELTQVWVAMTGLLCG